MGGLSVNVSVSFFTVFLQGLLSFFSACVLPLVPLYLGYLAGGAKTIEPDGTVRYKRGRVMLNTVFFVLGIAFAFFALGFGFSSISRFLVSNRMLFARISGIIIILFGLIQVGFFEFNFLQKERRIPFNLGKMAMNPAVALLLGFTFSFAWTPCVGPALASVVLLATGAKTAALGYLLIGVYTLGFVLPFLAVGLFTGTLLDLFKKHQKVVKYTAKAGGVLMIIIGVMTFTGKMNDISGYLSNYTGGEAAASSSVSEVPSSSPEASQPVGGGAASRPEESSSSVPEPVLAPDFTLIDQFGVEHTLSDYQGKTVFLNFWATWCGPCQREMPDIQALYEESGGNAEDLVVLGVANPKSAEAPYNQDVSAEEIIAFLENGGFTYPTVMDTTGDIFAAYAVSAFPTTFMIDVNGNVYGYVTGTITRDIMDSIVKQTQESVVMK